MKFLSLGLDRYGRFTDRRLDFDPAARVVVVLGANEAGKTTALAAACDVLFGIEERSRFNFLHDYKSMRLSATIADGSGRTLSFARLKRRQSTLVDADKDTPLPDDVLASFLGAHNKAAFRAIFGLDQERLREGGAKLLAGGGDLADTLIAAAPGLSRVAALRDQMKASAAELFNPDRASSRLTFYAAVGRYREADKARQESELRADAVRQARATVEETALDRKAAEQAETEAARVAGRAQSLRGAAKELRAIAAAEAARATLGPLPEVEAGFPALARERLAARNRAVEAAAEAQVAEDQARAARQAITVDEALLAEADDIARRDEERAQVGKELESLPNRRREADGARAELARIASGLELDGVETLRARLPGRPLLTRAEKLVDRLRDHTTRLDALAKDTEALSRRRRETEAKAGAEVPSANPAPLKRQLDALDGAETRATNAAAHARKLATAREALSARISRLPYGPWRAEDLVQRPLPDRAVAEAAFARLNALADAHARQTEQRDELSDKVEQLKARRTVLDAAGTAPTAQAITTRREARDALWRALRPVLLAQRPVAPQDAMHSEEFERALAAADRLADDRQSESQRVADLARTDLDLADGQTRLRQAQDRVDASGVELHTARAAWEGLWRESRLPPDEGSIAVLKEVEAIRAAADELLDQKAEAEQLKAAVDWDRVRAEELRGALGLPPLGAAPLAMAELRAAVDALTATFQRQRDRQRDQSRHDLDAADLASRKVALDMQGAELVAEVGQVFPPLCIRLEADPDEARAALGLWNEALAVVEKLVTAERRIAGIEQDEARFVQAVEGLLGRLGQQASGDLFATVRALRQRVESARQARARAEAADEQLAARTAAATAARAAQERAEEKLAEVLARAGVGDAAELPQQVDRLEQAARCAADLAAANLRLDDLRGGRDLEEIRAEIADRDDDALARHAAEAAEAHAAARAERDAAIVRHTQAEAAQEALSQKDGAAHAAQEMQDAIADMGAAMERFTREHVAARLLSFAIERYREAHQSPIVTRAASAFATLTGGRWSGIDIDYDQDPPRLGAVRDGRLHGVEALSEGTGDQLFLALRVAAIEEHARRATPLPFLADDLFVTFDEGRTEAGMRLLAELGAITQVIVFTHHAYVAECATRALGPAASIITL
ncbi:MULTISPECIES: YhaN family protein [unclassified Xanthobacter]|uniref:ATP-binding protein n=1 Tax=unclassified Xanthobacter TaxID=2623496 RepID=UPI001F1DC5A5|nr:MULTISPECIES: YhaN family protein [unclassified Xanthobacter]